MLKPFSNSKHPGDSGRARPRIRGLREVGLWIVLPTLLLVSVRARSILSQAPPPGASQTLHVLAGKSVVINMETRLRRVMISNPVAIDAVTTTPAQVVVTGKSPGASSLILWDEQGRSRMLDVFVDTDVSTLRDVVQQAYPNDHVQIEGEEDRVILSGVVSAPEDSENMLKMAANFSKTVVNSLSVAPAPPFHDRQVLLEVKFAEVDRTKLRQWGFNLFSLGSAGNVGGTTTSQYPAPLLTTLTGTIGAHLTGTTNTDTITNPLNLFIFRPDINLGAAIEALETKNILQILAAPNLMALNGKTASFLAGGRFPIPVVQGGTNFTAVTIQWQPFGVRLDFTGTISKDDVIRLKLDPEVSTLDYSDALVLSGFTIPAISTRRAETEIELKDGQSFGIAGLLDQRTTNELSKIPGIGDIPILGLLFRSKSYNLSRTELLVLVTPHIIDPVRVPMPAPAEPKPAMPFMNKPKYDKGLPQGEAGEKPAEQQPQTQ